MVWKSAAGLAQWALRLAGIDRTGDGGAIVEQADKPATEAIIKGSFGGRQALNIGGAPFGLGDDADLGVVVAFHDGHGGLFDLRLGLRRDRLRARLDGFALQMARVDGEADKRRQESPQRA